MDEKENNKIIRKKIFENLIIAVAMMLYFILINFSYLRMEEDLLLQGIKIASLIILFFSIIGAFIVGAINTIFSISSFWTYRSNEIIWSFYRMYTFTEYPITIYNKFIRILITVILPFAFVAYYPTMNYLGMDKYMIYLSPIIMIILWIIAVKVWNWALNKYRSTGN